MTAAMKGMQTCPFATARAAPIAVASTVARSCVDAALRAATEHWMRDLLRIRGDLGVHKAAGAVAHREVLARLRTSVCMGDYHHSDASRSPWMRGLSEARVPVGVQVSLYVWVAERGAAATHVRVLCCRDDRVEEWVAGEPRTPLAAGLGPDGGGAWPACALGRRHPRLDVCRRARLRGCPRGASRACARVSLQPGAWVRATRWIGARSGAARDLRARDERRINVAYRRSRFYGPAR